MKIRRYKKVTRHLNFYINSFGFRQPYQVLVDGTFCLAALNNQVNIADNISKYLQSEVKFLTTQCAIIETENFGYKLHGALIILKQYAVHKCGHEGKPLSGARCFQSMVSQLNKEHYIIATQDRDLQLKLITIPGVPILYLHSKAPVLTPPSEASIQKAEQNKNNKINISSTDKIIIDRLKNENNLMSNELERSRKRKGPKGPKGPNPLSCKKKKIKVKEFVSIKMQYNSSAIKHKRKEIRISKHVKELSSQNN